MATMTLKRMVLGSHVYFARSGSVIDSVTVSKTAKPTNDPTTNWVSLGCVDDVSIDRQIQEEESYCPSPGQYALDDITVIQKDMTISATLSVVSNAYFQMLMNSSGAIADGASSGAYVPNSGDGYLRGWFKLQQYDQSDTLIHAVDVWGGGRLSGAQELGRSVIRPQMEIRVFDSTLNTGALWTLPTT